MLSRTLDKHCVAIYILFMYEKVLHLKLPQSWNRQIVHMLGKNMDYSWGAQIS